MQTGRSSGDLADRSTGWWFEQTGSCEMRKDGEAYIVGYASIPLKGASDSWFVITFHREKGISRRLSQIGAPISY